MATAPHNILSVDDLRVVFQTPGGFVLANNGISFDHGQGEWLGIMGTSGSGKTVLAKAIAGFPTGTPGIISGTIRFKGIDLLEGLLQHVRVTGMNGTVEKVKKDMRKWRKERRSNLVKFASNQFAYIFQNPSDALNPYFKIHKHLTEAYRAAGVPNDEIITRGQELLADLRLESPEAILGKYPHELSGGEAQRVVIAMALAQGVSYIIADECTTSLDPSASLSAIEALQRARKMHNCSILFITHDVGLAEAFSDRILRMEKGKIAA